MLQLKRSVIAALGLWVPLTADAGTHLERLVGSDDVLWADPPGLTLEYALEPHAAGEYVVFFALATAGPELVFGVWLWDGNSYSLVVDSTMPPGQSGILTNRAYSVDETGLVAVTIETHAMIGWRDGTLHTIAAIGEESPDGPPGSAFSSLSHPVVSGGVVYFLGLLTNLPTNEAVKPFSWSEADGLQEIELPGLCCFLPPAPVDEGVFLSGTTLSDPISDWSIWFRSAEGLVSQFFSLTSGFPDSPGSSWTLPHEQLGTTSDGVVVMSEDSAHTIQGIYRIRAGAVVEPVMVTGDPDIGTGHPVWGVHKEFSTAGDRIAFRTGDHTAELPYRVVLQEADRSLHSIVAAGDVLDGAMVNYVDLSYGGLALDQLAMEVQRGNDIAVWLADLDADAGEGAPSPLEIPVLPPAGLALLAALLGLGALTALAKGRGVQRRTRRSGR